LRRQLRCPIAGRQPIKKRFAGVLVASIQLYRQPGVTEFLRTQPLPRPAERRLFGQPDRILRLCKRFRSQPENLPLWRQGGARILLTTAGWSIPATKLRLPPHGH
jgi:hypothetical protein